jgi:hypothetical protein
MLIRVCGKLKIKFTWNASFFRDGLSGWSFGSRQNSQCHGLDKSVLFCIKKVSPPASSDDAASNSDTKNGYHIGIGISYFSEEDFGY